MTIARAASLLLMATACGPKAAKDPLAEIEMLVRVYDGNTPTSTPISLPADAGSGVSKSNRPVLITFSNLNTLNETDSRVTKLEVTRVTNGVTSTCVILDENDKVFTNLTDWAAATTEYTLKASGATASRTFGPIAITVESAERVVTGGHAFGDQTNDAITSGGSFFQTRTVDIGSGGYTGPNFNTVLAHHNERLLDFQVVSVAGALKVISPLDIKANHTFPLLKNDCGYQKTVFEAYSGPLDPKAAPLTLTEIAALPVPASTATSLALTVGLKFVYQTGDGKKGLVLVDTLTGGASPRVGLAFSAAQ